MGVILVFTAQRERMATSTATICVVTTPSQAPLPTPRPTIGRVVHYVSFGTPGGEYHSACRAALVTEVSSCGEHGHVGLCVLNPTGIFFRSLGEGGCTYHEGYDDNGGETVRSYLGGSWHWPERVGE